MDREPWEAYLLAVPDAQGVLILRLDRPERRNAVATDVLQAIAAALQAAAADPACRVAVVTGTRDIFAAGADIGEIEMLGPDDPVDGTRYRAWQSIRAFPKPLVAAVEGWCLGAGLELAMVADIVVAGDEAQFGQPETNLGFIPGGGGTGLLTRRVGRALASMMILTGKPIGADRALAAGLIAEVVPAGSALERAAEIAAILAGRAPLALREAKACIRAADELPLSAHHAEERRRFIALMGTADKAEGIAAFRERRPPRWAGA
ncbi:enoyl-CoA hydratase-related protein [Sphingopyxis sp. 113P3]|uniref:enoyl-CoA hydratase-related protein n=1 Tax=Sphingopyxis sp. (strain 113P3) TaxID=292913 RepID=UPI0006AD4D06|nr:enoyl-CoA hydratase-related protein [Sphingopyxis sp. 113P3]ALC10495.1 2,3-dehydroadipyl-CoA hydratase [Sphingopyxis sp. 113P3]